jgi:hypothetical protein
MVLYRGWLSSHSPLWKPDMSHLHCSWFKESDLRCLVFVWVLFWMTIEVLFLSERGSFPQLQCFTVWQSAAWCPASLLSDLEPSSFGDKAAEADHYPLSCSYLKWVELCVYSFMRAGPVTCVIVPRSSYSDVKRLELSGAAALREDQYHLYRREIFRFPIQLCSQLSDIPPEGNVQ